MGDEIEAMVLNIDGSEKKIALSIKALSGYGSKEDFSAYMDNQGQATSNLGELLKEEMKKSNGQD